MNQTFKRSLCAAAAATVAVLPLAACDQTESHQKETTVRSTQTPDGGTKTTTETKERKVESSPRQPLWPGPPGPALRSWWP